jgi:hypothetical protein
MKFNVSFVDKNFMLVNIQYDWRSGNNWAFNHVFEIEGGYNNIKDIVPANAEQVALIEFIQNAPKQGQEYLGEFGVLANAIIAKNVEGEIDSFTKDLSDEELFDELRTIQDENGLDFGDLEKMVAIIKELQCEFITKEYLASGKIEVDSDTFTICGREYLVLTDSEADERADSYYRDNIQELLGLGNAEWERVSRYFDEDDFVNDCLSDGRGNALGCYDGREQSIDVLGTTYYIYRTH